MVFQFVRLIVPMYSRIQIVLCLILLCEVISSTIPSGADKKNTGGRGTIDFEEFLVTLARQMREEVKGKSDKDIAEFFRVFDSHADGFIDCSELHIAIMAAGEHVTEEEAHELIREWDKNTDGKLDLDEWSKLLKNDQ
ncbi:troponin C, skeletal muscle-like [Stegostoma tigrinum]|uniref:troponin C, skeletal muscle-like n=1 Tax=Stegostoma tigrinum TaxID=3053191 RepID=UPI00286FE994|nr:troponin C, skeletal muscle-like [Stegostoma tigrinum]XP_059508824.1 troponin C, skeletal muscle-like [Stegostoma tigrinum]